MLTVWFAYAGPRDGLDRADVVVAGRCIEEVNAVGDHGQAVDAVALHHVAAEERMARFQRVQRVAGQQAVGLDLHRRVEVVEEVVIRDVDVAAEIRSRRWTAAGRTSSNGS